MILRPLITIPFVVFLSLSCESAARLTPSEDREVSVVLRPTQSSLVEGEPVFEASETRITLQKGAWDEIQGAQFVNREKGWVTSYRSIYTTSDEGKTWERLSFKAPENSRISSFSFVDESRGWLAVWKQIHTERFGLGNSSIIFNTDDGGRTWNEQANFPAEVDIRQVTFRDAKNGLVIGSRTIDQPLTPGPPYRDMVVLKTVDGGQTWNEISEPVKASLAKASAGPDHGWHLRWISESELFLLTGGGRVLHSSDSGATWKILVGFKDAPPEQMVRPTGYYKILLDPENRIRILGGEMGPEGQWGDLIVDHDNSWTRHQLLATPIFDAIFLSANEVLASGMALPHVDEEPAAKPAGVILKSLDCGKSWTTVYRSNRREIFISLTKISDKEFYAVSDAGTFLKFTL